MAVPCDGEINSTHPFRDGNGRTQRAFIGQLTHDAGYRIDWSKLDPRLNIDASGAAHRGDNQPLRAMLGGSAGRRAWAVGGIDARLAACREADLQSVAGRSVARGRGDAADQSCLMSSCSAAGDRTPGTLRPLWTITRIGVFRLRTTAERALTAPRLTTAPAPSSGSSRSRDMPPATPPPPCLSRRHDHRPSTRAAALASLQT